MSQVIPAHLANVSLENLTNRVGLILSDVSTGNTSYVIDVAANASSSGLAHGIHTSVAVGSVLSLIILFTLAGNALVVCAVVNFRRLRSVTNHFVVSLAVADITVALLVMPYSIMYELYGRWYFGWVFCYFWNSCDITCCTASILHLCVISLDRYLAITEPLAYRRRMSRRRALLLIAVVWLASISISFVPIYMGWFADTSHVQLHTDSTECGLYVNRIYAVITSLLSFYIPLTVMFLAYYKIFKIAHRQSEEIRKLEIGSLVGEADCRGQKKKMATSHDLKALRTLGTMMGLFCACWLPFFLMYLILPFCPRCALPAWAVSLITWLGYVNSCINPCVYAYLNRDFRTAFTKLLLCGRCGSRQDRSNHVVFVRDTQNDVTEFMTKNDDTQIKSVPRVDSRHCSSSTEQ